MRKIYTFIMLWLCAFFTVQAVTISGSINSILDDSGNLNVILYTQANYEANNYSSYVDVAQQSEPVYPVDYVLNAPSAGVYAVVVYIDSNNNNTPDAGEPIDAIDSINVASENVTGQDFSFGDEPDFALYGSISYAGSVEGDVYVYVFTQADFLAQDLSTPVGLAMSEAPDYPIDYQVEVSGVDTYVILSFIDENSNSSYDIGEAVVYETNVEVSSDSNFVEVNLELPVEEKVSVSGTIEYDGTTIGDLYIFAFLQSDYDADDYSNPQNMVVIDDPNYPYDYELMCADENEFIIFAFIDFDGNEEYDLDEPLAIVENVTVAGEAITDLDMRLEQNVEVTGVFQLDTLASTWNNGTESGTFHDMGGGLFSPGTKDGYTAMTMNSFEQDSLLYGFGFWIDESDSDDLDSSYLIAGTKLHLEYTFPDTLAINFIAVGSLVEGVTLTDGRLAIDIEVVDPVQSASGDFDASCGITISCDPKHSGGIDCYGSVYYGDLYVHDMGFALSEVDDKVGLRVNGYNGVEGHLTALLSDSLLN